MNEDKLMERIEREVVDASMTIAKFGFAHCVAEANGDIAKAQKIAAEFAVDYCESLTHAVLVLITGYATQQMAERDSASTH